MIDRTPKTRICKMCGQSYESVAYNVYYCVPCRKKKRQQVAHNAYRKKHPEVIYDKTCRVCGKAFKGSRSEIYCSDECSEKGKKLPAMLSQKEAYMLYLPKGHKKVMEKCRRSLGFSSVSDLLKEALKQYLDKNVTDEQMKNDIDRIGI